MSLLLSILVVMSTWLLFQQWFLWQRRRRRTIAISSEQGLVREVVDNLELVVTPSKTFLGFVGKQSTHTVGRLVMTEQWLVLSCDQGMLMKADRGQSVALKRLGPQRLILIGQAINSDIQLRTIVTLNGDDTWVGSLHYFCR